MLHGLCKGLTCRHAGGADDNAVVMVICKKQEWLVDLMIEPGRLLPLRPDVTPQTSTLFRVSGAASEVLNGKRSMEGDAAMSQARLPCYLPWLLLTRLLPMWHLSVMTIMASAVAWTRIAAACLDLFMLARLSSSAIPYTSTTTEVILSMCCLGILVLLIPAIFHAGLEWDQVESSEGPPLIVLSSNDSNEVSHVLRNCSTQSTDLSCLNNVSVILLTISAPYHYQLLNLRALPSLHDVLFCYLQLSTSQPHQMPIAAPPLPPSALGTSLIQPFFQNEEMARFLGYNAAPSSQQHDSAALHPTPHGAYSIGLVSQNGNQSEQNGNQPQQPAAPVWPTIDPSSTAPSAPLTPPSLLTPSSQRTAPYLTASQRTPQSSQAMAAPQAQTSRVPMSPFMADAEHSYASPSAANTPPQMAWEPFGNDQSPVAGELKQYKVAIAVLQ